MVSIATKGTVSAPTNPLMEDPFFRRFFGFPDQQQQQRRRQVQSAGSGVIVDAAKGYILTNHHVVENAEEIEVVLTDNRSLKAKVVGSDPGTDIAVLQVENGKGLVQMKLGNSDQVQVGDFVLAIGNPFGLQHTVTSGIVSALGRSGINPDGYEDFIQTDASINPGNSGGALVNLKGELVGINSAIFSNSGGNIGIGFAIPVNIAKSIMNQILQFGEVKRGLLGVSISDFNADSAKAYGVEGTAEGALVQEVVDGSAAEKAGIEVGDVIVSVDGQRIKSASDLRNTVGLKRSGDSVRVDVIRDGKRRQFTALLSEVSSTARIGGDDIHPWPGRRGTRQPRGQGGPVRRPRRPHRVRGAGKPGGPGRPPGERHHRVGEPHPGAERAGTAAGGRPAEPAHSQHPPRQPEPPAADPLSESAQHGLLPGMPAMVSCCILGGSGFVGSRLVARLANAGHQVTVPTRDPERCRHLRLLPTVRVIHADIHAPATLERLLRGRGRRDQPRRHSQRARPGRRGLPPRPCRTHPDS